MVFSSLIFLYAFFPFSLLAYFLCKTQKAKNASLLIFSLIFYAWGEPKYVFLLMFMALVSWFCAKKVAKCQSDTPSDPHAGRLFVVIAAVVDILLIGFFKYAGMFASLFGEIPDFIRNIALPIGISFYTFQLLTYVADVYRKDAPAQKSYWNVLLYAALFHQCIAGPIVRYGSIAGELFDDSNRKPDAASGVRRFSVGLAKKALVANACGSLADKLLPVSGFAAAGATALGTWTGLIAYSLQIYLDFSAYSDMAIGMGRMLGLTYPENFNYPYIARSVTDFWRRWHISLSTFFRDYVYIPLGGSRCRIPRMVLNTLIVWLLTGLWHGAGWNFVCWGLWFFIFLMLERAFLKKWLDKLPVLSNLYLLFVVILGWVIFRFESMADILAVLSCLFGGAGQGSWDFPALTSLKNNMFLLAFSIFICLPILRDLYRFIDRKIHASSERHPLWGRIWNLTVSGLLPAVLLILSTAALVGDSYNPFLYFQF